MLQFKIAESPLYKYGLAVTFTALALALSSLFWPIIVGNAPFLFFIGAVVLSSWLGGMGPGMLSAAIAIVSSDFFLFEPRYQVLNSPINLLQFSIFSLVALLISWLEDRRNQSERSLREVRDELAIILNSVGDGITAQDKTGQPVFANISAAHLTGYPSPEVMIETPITVLQRKYEMFDEANNPFPFSEMPRHHVFKYGENASRTFRIRFSDTNEERWISLKSAPVFDDQGNVKLAVNVFHDITDQILAEQDRARIADIVRNSNDAIIGKSLDRMITSWNPAAEKLYGYTAEEAVGQHISLIYPDFDDPDELQLHDRVHKGEVIQQYETYRLHKHGHKVEIALTISPIRTSSGQIVGFSTVERDITARKQIDRMRQETQERLRKLLDNLEAFVGVLTPDGVLIEANRSSLKAANLSAEEVLGKHFAETYWWSFSEESQARLRDAIDRVAGGETIRYDAEVRLSTDRFITINFILAPLFDDNGQVQYLIPSGIDVTERNQLTNQLDQEKRRLNSILNSIPGIVYEGSRDLENQKMEFISSYAEKLLGYSLDEWYARPNFWEDVIHPDDRQSAQEQTLKTYMQGIPGPVLFRCITKDGQIRYTESYNGVITDEIGKRTGTCGFVLDVTERRQREQEIIRLTSMIETQRQRLDSIIRNLPGIVFDTTIEVEKGEQTVNFMSAFVEEMLGYSPENWKKDPNFWQTIVPAEDLETALKDATAAYENDRRGETQFRCRNASGETVYAESYYNFVTEGNLVRQFGVIMDITERKMFEHALSEYTEELRRSNEELERFAYVASHDLQEPLRMVTSYLQLVEQRYRDVVDEDGKEFIHFAVDGATRMKSLINDLLTYSRVQRSTAEFTTVNVQQVLDRVMQDLQLLIEDTRATVTHDNLPEIIANEPQITQLLQNLLGNALKFHAEQPPQIHIAVKRIAQHWQFSVSDNGIGIEPDYQERIFVIFQRLHSREEYPGTGIGLAVCRKIIDKHGGRIWVESKPGEGSTFHFTIPTKQRKRLKIHASN